ncbi:gp217 [Bacillus phage G]|uniref:Gp217 n=1 Tax=Bacillus phage G TaxID=2884420 RepID=G3M9V8_9CAUD|nr:gp217 [Bacillus phage G]AEO93476.1 gp217 [Bacillus phage G]
MISNINTVWTKISRAQYEELIDVNIFSLMKEKLDNLLVVSSLLDYEINFISQGSILGDFFTIEFINHNACLRFCIINHISSNDFREANIFIKTRYINYFEKVEETNDKNSIPMLLSYLLGIINAFSKVN